jgi:hypothetical protein
VLKPQGIKAQVGVGVGAMRWGRGSPKSVVPGNGLASSVAKPLEESAQETGMLGEWQANPMVVMIEDLKKQSY